MSDSEGMMIPARTGMNQHELAVGQASPATRLVDLWLHGRSRHTQRAYRADVERFLAFVQKPLEQVTLADLQAFADELDRISLAPSSRARALSAIKSLLTFGHRLGVLPVNAGAPLRLPPNKNALAERILSEAAVQRMLALETDPRNRTLLLLLYAGGLRVSEACGLRWRDLQARGDMGQITVWGKGSKTRVVLLPPSVWKELLALHHEAGPDDPVFRSQRGGALSSRQAERIVRAAAEAAGIKGEISPHWLRHAHVSHALDRGAPIHLVQQTVGHASIATTGRYAHARPTDSSARFLPV